MPPEPGQLYIIAGDMRTGYHPRRDAPVVAMADVTEKPYRLAYFHSGAGKDSYNPFLQSYRYALDKYTSALNGIHATVTQKGIDELAFEKNAIRTHKLKFSPAKNSILNALSMDITTTDASRRSKA